MDDPRPASLHSLTRRNLRPARPVKARPAPLRRRMLPDDAARAILSSCLAQIAANAAVLRAGRSAEGLHQLRVGMRRLEVALKDFAEAFDQPWLEELRGRTKVLSSRLGAARDLDVFLEDVLPVKQAAGLFTPLAAPAGKARDDAWREAEAILAGADFALFVDDVASLAHSRLPLSHDRKLSRAAERILEKSLKRARKRGAAAKSRKEGDLHRLRIALKKLRYTSEFFAPLYKRAKTRSYLKQLRHLQDALGRLNDIAHVDMTLARLAAAVPDKDGELRQAAGALQGWYRAGRPALVKKAMKRWRKLRRRKPFWA